MNFSNYKGDWAQSLIPILSIIFIIINYNIKFIIFLNLIKILKKFK